MKEFLILILVAFFAINLLDKTESVKLELKSFDEIFGEGWWDKGEAEDLKTPAPTNFGQNVHHQIDRQNTQIGQIEPNSNDQNPPLISTDLTFPLRESEQKRKIIDKFIEMKDKFKQKGKYSTKEWVQLEKKIAKDLNVNRSKIYEWKKEFGLSRRNPKNERKNLLEKFDQIKAELRRAGFKSSYKHEIDKTVAKELGISDTTIYRWKHELCQTKPNKHSGSEQKELMKRYYEIKDKSPKIGDGDIAKSPEIGTDKL